MINKNIILVTALLCAACSRAPEPVSSDFCDFDAHDAVAALVDAHGGLDAWRSLDSLYVEREHLFAGTEQPIRFNIHGEYPSHRMIQNWQVPAGTFAWDGERAWSADWPLAAQLMPRYVAGIGFYLVNMPWLVHEHADRLESRGCSGTLPGRDNRRYLVVTAHYEPDPVRKPDWYDGTRDTYDLYIDPETRQLGGVMQHWTYAGRLDTANLPVDVEAISQLFVPDTYAEVNGLLMPHTYTAYSPTNEVAATGRFFDYDVGRAFDERLLVPADPAGVDWDTSSSYLRRH